MVFTSTLFIFIFLPLCILFYTLTPKRYKNFTLFLFSVIFYAWGGVQYAILVVVSAFINYILGIQVGKTLGNKRSKSYLVMAIVLNLGILGVFKYFNFFVTSLEGILSLVLKTPVVFNEPLIPLPIGISFFTFQILSYVIDVYRGQVQMQKSFINLGLYIMLFPQLIAGPIVRYIDVEKEIQNRKVTLDNVRYGLTRFVFGFAKKIFLANMMGNLSDTLLTNMQLSPTVFAWAAAVCYALQIFFDFSAYSDMAIGLGKIFGFTFRENFNYPYTATSIQDFWRRWHISLSTWFKDYLYIPLGGNRKGMARTYLNLLIVFFLTGLWHGASWNFVLWGLFHGFFLILERTKISQKILAKLPCPIRRIYTLVVVLVGWVFFDLTSLSQALNHVVSMFSFNFSGWENILVYLTGQYIVIFIIALILCTPVFKAVTKKFNKESTAYILCGDITKCALFAVSVAYMLGSAFNPFIYFRF